MVLLHSLLLGLCAVSAVTSQCTPNIPDADRRNCFAGAAGTWPGLNQSVCEARGCVWCNSGAVQCYANDYVCPSSIAEASRVDCHPEPGASRAACNNRGCVWCEASSSAYPYCFYDSAVSQGGVRCPTDIPEAERVDCWPHALSANTEKYCLARSCYYCASSTPNVPWCVKPREHGYSMVGQPTATTKGWTVDATRKSYPTWFGADVQTIRVDAEFHESHRLRVKIYDPSKARFEVPLQIPSPDRVAANTLYDIQFVNDDTFGIIITRKSTGAVIFDSTLAGIEFADQGLVMAWRVPTDKVYGFGETEHHAFKHAFNWEKWGMFARDQPVTVGNLYGVHPFYLGLDSTTPASSTSAYGVLILNSNPQEIQMMPAPGITYRTQGGILDFYFFLGPTPENVVQQYTEAVGRPIMPAYWGLGFQLSRYGFNTLDNMKAAVGRTRQYDIPLDVVHGDIDYFRENLDFTYDTTRYAGLPQYVDQLHAEGTKFITILDPFISTGEPAGTYPPYERGNQLQVWITQSDGVTPALGKCWPEDPAYYPDYSKQSCTTWWTQECVDFHSVIAFDGLWIDMNEPASFVAGSMVGCANNMLNEPPWIPQALLETKLYDKTFCMDYRDTMGSQYNTHSLYGWAETLPSLWATRNATGGKRSIVIGRSTFPGAGKYEGHWTGDNQSSWAHLFYSIIGVLEFNLFGIPYVGPDICGYFQDTTEELCHRWMQLGAFFTFARNHNGFDWIDQDPGVWPAVASASRAALHVRYALLPYMYTLFHYAHTKGDTVTRPLLHEFVTDPVTYTIDRQLLLGPALLVTPVVDQGATTVRGYFPNARWYDWYTGAELAARGAYSTLSAPLETINVHLRGGYVIPTQEPANSTVYSRTKPMGLIVTLSDSNSATGSLFWDEGDTIDTYETNQYFLAEYVASPGSLTGSVSFDGYPATGSLIFKTVSVYGVSTTITSVTVNSATWTDFTYNTNTKVLLINNLAINVASTFTVTWA